MSEEKLTSRFDINTPYGVPQQRYTVGEGEDSNSCLCGKYDSCSAECPTYVGENNPDD